MALSKKNLTRIERALKNYKSYLKFKAIGPQSLTREELKELVRSGMIPMNTKAQAPVLQTYLDIHEQSVDADIAPKSTRDAALNFLERTHARYIDKAADQFKADILSTVEGTIMPIIDRREGAHIYEALQDPKLHSKNLRGLLADKVENWQYRYKAIINTELNRAANWGAADAILHNNAGSQPENILVYKVGNKPGAGSCETCAKIWYLEDGVTPRVYTLETLAMNGTNIGRKQKDWLPTIDSTHPSCTHILHELRPGFGFVNGSLEYISADHDEMKKQKTGL